MHKIGVFDSGVGGLTVANAIKSEFLNTEIILREDKANLPYGNKSAEQLYDLVLPILKDMIKDGCEIIVIACNTVTTTILNKLREVLDIPLIGIEPMIKPAGKKTKTKVIAVCATPTTLNSQRYNELKSKYAEGIKVIEPDCSDWAYLIENNKINQQKLSDTINKCLDQGADVIVLGCTHYHWIDEDIKELAGKRAVVINPESAIVKRLKTVLEQLP